MLRINFLTFCDMRFIKWHDSIVHFAELFSDVLSGLQDITAAVNMDEKNNGQNSLFT